MPCVLQNGVWSRGQAAEPRVLSSHGSVVVLIDRAGEDSITRGCLFWGFLVEFVVDFFDIFFASFN